MADVNFQAKSRHQGYKNKGKDPDVSNQFCISCETLLFGKLCAINVLLLRGWKICYVASQI